MSRVMDVDVDYIVNMVTKALKSKMEKEGSFVDKTNGDILAIRYNDSEQTYQVYKYGNVFTDNEDCDLISSWRHIEDFVYHHWVKPIID